MSETIGTAFVEIRPKSDVGHFQSEVEKDLHPAASRLGAGVGKLLGVGIVGGIGGAAVGLAAVLKTGFGEVKDYSAGFAQLQAGIKSTGGAAGVTAPQLETLASKIQDYSGQTDDSIVASEKLLLTFTNIKNSGPDKIFDQATAATADMAAKMGGDASGAAIQLGKALNDPIKGISALSRVGVSFDDAQKKTIETMVKAGDTAGAQKVILGELNKEFGGAAKAAGDSLPGALERAHRSFEDVSQNIVTSMLPVINKLLTFILRDVIPGISSLATWLQAHLGPAFAAVGKFVTNDVLPVVTKMATFFTGTVLPVLQRVAGYLGGALRDAFDRVRAAIEENRPQLEKLATIIGKVAEVAGKILGPIIVVLAGLIIRTLGVAISHGINILGEMVTAVQKVADAFGWVIDKVKDLIGWLGKIHVPSISLPHIPGFASGGTLGPGLSIVGENGPELVVSARGGERVFSNSASNAMLASAGSGAGDNSGHSAAMLERLDAVVASNERLEAQFARQNDRYLALTRSRAFTPQVGF